MRDIEKGRLTSSYGYYYGEDESLRAELDDRNSKMIYDMVFKAASEAAYNGCNEDDVRSLVDRITDIEKRFGKYYPNDVARALYCTQEDKKPQWVVDNFLDFKKMIYDFYK